MATKKEPARPVISQIDEAAKRVGCEDGWLCYLLDTYPAHLHDSGADELLPGTPR